MKPKHLRIRIEQCLVLAKSSNCTRGRYAAMLLDPHRNIVLADAYNGAPRGGGQLCGGDRCLRDGLTPHTNVEIGCHHAETNLICNAAANGIQCKDAWLICTGEPCLLCAKLIHHAGIAKVIIVDDPKPDSPGRTYLIANGLEVQRITQGEAASWGD